MEKLKASNRPIVTLKEVREYFEGFGEDVIEAIIGCPDLIQIWVGPRKWYFDRDNWENFLNNMKTYGGRRDLSRGFGDVGMITCFKTEPSAITQLRNAGLSEEIIERLVGVVKEKGTQQGE